MHSTSYIELDKEALGNNIDFLKSLFHDIKISSVVKGNAYGHGIAEYIPIAESQGLDHFSVHSADEAKEVMKALTNTSSQIMIMGFIDNDDLKWAIENQVSFFVFEFDRLIKAAEIANSLNKTAQIHIELETGMNRTGFAYNELDTLVSLLKANTKQLNFLGLCTHFAGAESIANHVRVQKQKEQYTRMQAYLKENGLEPEMKHTCCSAASIRLPEMRFDMVRIGILQYGFWPSREVFIEHLKGKKLKEDPLKRIISWRSTVMNIKQVEIGEFIGYGTTYLAQRDTTIAIVPIGYSHGFSRSLSNQGRVLINGYRVPVVGIVNMNNMAVDVTEVPQVRKGDEVILIGKEKEVEISVSSFGELSDQLNYELLTRLPAKIPRRIK
ncbi:alanine racemase [Ekhidna sp. To15]|uniref:alanine racemase n=1 Tax=Ekhidna sp. To15 TaxID=3395267 RepID=UPI003F5227EB